MVRPARTETVTFGDRLVPLPRGLLEARFAQSWSRPPLQRHRVGRVISSFEESRSEVALGVLASFELIQASQGDVAEAIALRDRPVERIGAIVHD